MHMREPNPGIPKDSVFHMDAVTTKIRRPGAFFAEFKAELEHGDDGHAEFTFVIKFPSEAVAFDILRLQPREAHRQAKKFFLGKVVAILKEQSSKEGVSYQVVDGPYILNVWYGLYDSQFDIFFEFTQQGDNFALFVKKDSFEIVEINE